MRRNRQRDGHGSRHRQAGTTLLETVLALGVAGIIGAAAAGILQEQSVQVRDQAAALQMRQINQAMREYAEANLTQLVADSPTTITIGQVGAQHDLLTTGEEYLPESFRDVVNPYGQRYQARVRSTGDGEVQVLVYTVGGREIPQNRIAGVATKIGAEGGYIGVPAAEAGNNVRAVGAYGGWETEIDTFDAPSGDDPEEGRLASLLWFGETGLVNDVLYRTEVPGFEDANRMFTNLHMDGNDITEIGCVKFGPAGEECGDGDPMNEIRAAQARVLNDLHQGRILQGSSSDPNNRLITDMSTHIQNQLEVDGQITGHSNIYTDSGNIVTDLGNIQTARGEIRSLNGNVGTMRGGVYARSGTGSLTEGLGAPYNQPGSIWADNVIAAGQGLQTFKFAGAGTPCSASEAGMLAQEGTASDYQGTILQCSRNTEGNWTWKSAFMGDMLVEEEVACHDDYQNDSVWSLSVTCPSGTRVVGCTGSRGASTASVGYGGCGYCSWYYCWCATPWGWRWIWAGWYWYYWGWWWGGWAGQTMNAGYTSYDLSQNGCVLKVKNPQCNYGWGWWGGWWWGRYYHRYWWNWRYHYWWYYPYRYYWHGNWWNWWHYNRPQDAELQRVQALCERL